MQSVSQILQQMPAKCYESRAAYATAVRRFVVARVGQQPFASIEDVAGNCLVCGESGRCPGWHLEEEFTRAGVEPFKLEATA